MSRLGFSNAASLKANECSGCCNDTAANAFLKCPLPPVGVVGLPNVGKSSLINSLKRKHAAATGNTPGVTTAVQEVHLDKKVTLLDSPGIVFSAASNAHAALLNCAKVRQTEASLMRSHHF